MLFQFYGLYCKKVNASLGNFSRSYARALISTRRREEEEVTYDEAKPAKEKIPIITCKKRIFNFHKGQTYNKKEQVPLASKGWKHKEARGDYFYIHPQEDNEAKQIDTRGTYSFEDLDIDPSLRGNLDSLNLREPLEIQRLGIPMINRGCNIILAAETGCGKTLAYLLPLISRILHWKQGAQRDVNSPLGLIVTPTRELAVQIGLELIKLSKDLGIQTKIITGGKTKRKMRNPPVSHVDILVGSFGVISKLTTVGIYKLGFVKFVVLDEADALFHSTFEEKVKIFMRRLPVGYLQQTDQHGNTKTAQLVLASATLPSRLQQVLGDIMNIESLNYVRTSKLHTILVLQKFIRLGPDQKPVELLKYIKRKVSRNMPVIVFTNDNRTSYWLTLFLNECGVKTGNLNGSMPLEQRRGKYKEFLNGTTKVLSATNAGSRGLDTLMVNHILNYDFPLDTTEYIHRCGRTGRMGTIGNCRVTNFISTPQEILLVQKIERAVRKMKPIPIINLMERIIEPEAMEEVEDESETEYVQRMVESIDDAEDIPF